jgi:hypothetical protein
VIFLFLIIGSEGILVHDESRGFVCAARSGKFRDYFFADGYSVGSPDLLTTLKMALSTDLNDYLPALHSS